MSNWIKQTGNSFINYAVVTGIQKNGAKKVVALLVDDYGLSKAKKTSTMGWNPAPVVILESEVPAKIRGKILTKLGA